MSAIVLELALIVVLFVLNGVLAMSEIAIVTARRPRLQRRAKAGDAGAGIALQLIDEPTQFLSTVQVGITLVGIVAGALGGATIAGEIAALLAPMPGIGGYAVEIAFVLVVACITYLSLIIGELVPKRIAMSNPERIASLVSRPMRLLSRISRPIVRLLTASTNLLLRLLRVSHSRDNTVTDEDVRALVAQGTASGTIHAGEEELVERVLQLGDRPVRAIMTPRPDLEWITLDEDAATLRQLLLDSRRTRLLVCGTSVDDVVGVVLTRDVLRQCIEHDAFDVVAVLKQPLFVPESTPVLRLLELFRQSEVAAAVVLDEFGGVQGMATVADIFADLVGDIPGAGRAPDQPAIVERSDGSWLVEGSAPVEELEEAIGLERTPGEEARDYQTVAGLVLTHLGRVPQTGDTLDTMGFRFEVVDMDGRRIDRLIVSRLNGDADTPP
jgi:putative hemolysin